MVHPPSRDTRRPPGCREANATRARPEGTWGGGVGTASLLDGFDVRPLRVLPDPGEQLAVRGHDLVLVRPVGVPRVVAVGVLLARDGREHLLPLPVLPLERDADLAVRELAEGV